MADETNSNANDNRMQKVQQVQDTAQSLIADWRRALTHAVDETEKFTKDKPLVALAASFSAGIVFNELMSALFRRRK